MASTRLGARSAHRIGSFFVIASMASLIASAPVAAVAAAPPPNQPSGLPSWATKAPPDISTPVDTAVSITTYGDANSQDPAKYHILPGASVSIPELGLAGVTDSRGQIRFGHLSVSQTPYLPITVKVSKVGYGAFQLTNADLRKNIGLEINAVLGTSPKAIRSVSAEENLAQSTPAQQTGPSLAAGPQISSCSGYTSTGARPSTIRVWRRSVGATGVTTYPFEFYVKHVLPHEWISTWPANSLRAGAVAVTDYAWYFILHWRGGTAPDGSCFDVDDTTSYQVFDPNSSATSTDNAVIDAWNWIVRQGNTIFETSYCSSIPSCSGTAPYDGCGTDSNGNPNTNGVQMSQTGSKACSDQGMAWTKIVTLYYYPNVFFDLASGTRLVGDFDGDGRADHAVWRPQLPGVDWWIQLATGATYEVDWGQPGDVPVPGQYEGGSTWDLAIYRPSTGDWWILYRNGSYLQYNWGQPCTINSTVCDWPVPGNYEGTGKTDLAIWRPHNPGTDWFIFRWNTGTELDVDWGQPGDVPVPGNYFADGYSDWAVFRPQLPGTDWYVLSPPAGSQAYVDWGQPGDVPVPADYDGDGHTDYAIWRPANPGNDWYINGSLLGPYYVDWGQPGDIAVPASYNPRNANYDFGIFRPTLPGNDWYILYSNAPGSPTYFDWGQPDDVPV